MIITSSLVQLLFLHMQTNSSLKFIYMDRYICFGLGKHT